MNELSRGQRIASRESERYEARDDELTAVSQVRVLFGVLRPLPLGLFLFFFRKTGSRCSSVPHRKRCGIIISVQSPNRPLIDYQPFVAYVTEDKSFTNTCITVFIRCGIIR